MSRSIPAPTRRGGYLIGAISVAALVLASCSDAEPTSDVHQARRHSQDYDVSPVSFRAMDDFFETQGVGAQPGAPLPTDLQPLDFTLELGGQTMGFQDALAHTDTNAILVIQNGAVVYEQYRNGAEPDSRFISWSMAKSFVSILVGAAVDAGHIASIEDPVEDYVPELRGTVFEGVSIRHMLMMRAGSSYREQRLMGQADVDTLAERSIIGNQGRFTDISVLDLTRKSAAGDVFNYSTLTASLLGRVVEGATGQTLAQYTETALWWPAGMQHSAYWMLDGAAPDGHAFGGGGFNATLRDYGRIGLMMLQDGRINGRQVLSREWVEVSTHHEGAEPVIPHSPRGYGYQWWTFLDTEIFEAVGIHGQFISVDPATNTVIVKLSYWPTRGSRDFAVQNHELLTAIRAELQRR